MIIVKLPKVGLWLLRLLLLLGKLTVTLGFLWYLGYDSHSIVSSKPRAHPSGTSGTVEKFDGDCRDAI